MENIKAIIINLQPTKFVNDKTGEITEMLKVSYTTPVDETDFFIGNVVLEGYTKKINIEMLRKVLNKEIQLTVNRVPLKNGFKYSLVAINNEKLK